MIRWDGVRVDVLDDGRTTRMTRNDRTIIGALMVACCIALSLVVYDVMRSAAYRARCIAQGGEAVAAYVCIKPGSRINVSMEGWR